MCSVGVGDYVLQRFFFHLENMTIHLPPPCRKQSNICRPLCRVKPLKCDSLTKRRSVAQWPTTGTMPKEPDKTALIYRAAKSIFVTHSFKILRQNLKFCRWDWSSLEENREKPLPKQAAFISEMACAWQAEWPPCKEVTFRGCRCLPLNSKN